MLEMLLALGGDDAEWNAALHLPSGPRGLPEQRPMLHGAMLQPGVRSA